MEPQPFRGAQVGDSVEWIDRAAVDGPRTGHDAEGAPPHRAVGRDRGTQSRHVQAQVGVDGDDAQRTRAKAEQLGGFVDAGVPFLREIQHQGRLLAAQPIAAHVPTVLSCGALAGGGKAGERGHRAAADEQAYARTTFDVGGEADQLHQPAHDATLQVDRGVVAACATWVHRGGQ